MLRDEALQTCLQGQSAYSPTAAKTSEPGAEETAAQQRDAESGLVAPIAPHLPGHFGSAQYEADCARFVSRAKRLAHCRAETIRERSGAEE